ncbi:MAG: hypothetical protein HRT94_07775 [Alphaproteobacteria bacterium]|nr:hypothetical protein [Alphaproteobacteria bacterium]
MSTKSTITRVIPGPYSEHRIVSMPSWAWFWLDDFVSNCSPNGYKGLYEAFGDAIQPENLSEALRGIAELHQDHCLREIYNLANDDEPSEEDLEKRIEKQTVQPLKTKKKPQDRTPKIYKLFGFMPCPTTLDAVWERQHYSTNQINKWLLDGDNFDF